jgi:hypothetical protein
MSGTICWNLLAAYSKGTNWYEASLMTAFQPWSGAFWVSPVIWVTAHTTQFSAPGWNYLINGTGIGTGAGLLQGGGSYVTLQSPDASDFSIVIEKFSHDHSTCVRPALAPYSTTPETATFQLAGSMASVTQVRGRGWEGGGGGGEAGVTPAPAASDWTRRLACPVHRSSIQLRRHVAQQSAAAHPSPAPRPLLH